MLSQPSWQISVLCSSGFKFPVGRVSWVDLSFGGLFAQILKYLSLGLVFQSVVNSLPWEEGG